MTKEELREHCEKQVKMCEEWAKGNDREPNGKIYEEHKLILDLIKAAEQQSCDDCVSRKAVVDFLKNHAKTYDDKRVRMGFLAGSSLVNNPDNVPSVTPTHCIAEVRFSKDDLREICNERIEIACEHGTCKDCRHRNPEDKKCDCGHDIQWQLPREDDWYCADFEKRGNKYGNT